MTTLTAKTKVLIALSSVIILHIICVSFYTLYTKEQAFIISREKAFDEIVYLIDKLKSTTTDHYPALIKNAYVTHLQLSITTAAEWDNKITTPHYWLLDRLFPQDKPLQFSYLLSSGNWLNVYFQGSKHSFALQGLMIFLEALVLLLMLYSFWIVERFNEPLKNFIQMTNNFKAHLPMKLAENKGPLAIREMAQAMNKLQLQVDQLLAERTEMLIAISHDLRMPLTRLKLRTEGINETLIQDKALRDIDEMNTMISQILYYAKQTQVPIEFNKIDITTLLLTLQDELLDMGHQLQFKCPTPSVIGFGDAALLKRALNNILQNAIRYSTQITLSLRSTNQTIVIQISDNGPGIPADDLEKVLNPFYRVNTARTHEGGNIGLGLTISHTIVERLHGHLTLNNQSPSGLCVTITLPLTICNKALH
jgi:signal transduction histidine kinase